MTELVSTTGTKTVPPENEEVVELSLLLSGSQAEALEAIAFQHGLTTGELVRRLVCNYLATQKVAASTALLTFSKHVGGISGL